LNRVKCLTIFDGFFVVVSFSVLSLSFSFSFSAFFFFLSFFVNFFPTSSSRNKYKRTTDQELMGLLHIPQQTFHFHSLGGSTTVCCVKGHHVKSKIRHLQSIFIYAKNISSRFNLKRQSLRLFAQQEQQQQQQQQQQDEQQ